MRFAIFFLIVPAVTFAQVRVMRAPNGGIQPQAVVDSTGNVHLIYLSGEDGKADIHFVKSSDAGKTWSKPLRVNSQAGAAVAVGTVRGAHIALGKNARIHVAWMGSSIATPKGPGDSTPMLYARMNDAGDSFEEQRNMIQSHPGLDGGGSIATDPYGRVFIAWHAPTPGKKGEANRSVWMTWSSDDGKTFNDEMSILTQPTGVCGCCGMRLFAAGDNVVALIRAANDQTRDMYLLSCRKLFAFDAKKLGTWATKTCPMSTASFATKDRQIFAAWETEGQIQFAALDEMLSPVKIVEPPGKTSGRKHPSIAVGGDGTVVLAWAQGTAWKKGGSLVWQAFDRTLAPLENQSGKQTDLPVWSLPAAVATRDGFLIVY